MPEAQPIPQQQPPPGRDWPLPIQVRPERQTPVFGTAEPAEGPAAALRRRAYALPDHHPMHWLLLLSADRLATTSALLEEAKSPGGQQMVLRHFGRQIAGQPKGAAIIAGLAAGALLARKLAR
jgi:tRNA A37 threonylcarbamoyladenosine synthetase subunit TsaC/SUA5/YrdC